ncbi:hypothetical protein IGI04_023392 [Brassica rapa subsp. trilocularis]|uniref:Uncharacterized protein n=1 Tax=Brassica rapa subsp. trilocularis TaxID=1813537 RepID=A0ABQ7M3R5_BRACM|nr:hypothetical protein IGI04_023392 [Brassica rapa subsp. trilocularis]
MEKDAYIKMAAANAKVVEASNELVAMMEGHLLDHPSREEVEAGKIIIRELRIKRARFEGGNAAHEMAVLAASNKGLEASRDRDIRKASWTACRTLPENYGGFLKAPKKKWEK